MATWSSRGLRGSALEEIINRTNEQYASKGLAVIQKIPTPITPIRIDRETRHITLAYFEKKSTVDYIGAVQGIPVCFDAKECAALSFPLANVHEHQVNFMNNFERQGAVAFLILYFAQMDRFYYMTLDELNHFWNLAKSGGKKRFSVNQLQEGFFFEAGKSFPVPYLDMIQKDLERREL